MVKFYHWKNKCIDLEKNIAFWCNVPKCSGGASHPEHNGELTISGEGKFGIVRVTGDDGVLRIVEIIAGNGHFIPIELFETIRNTLPPQTAMVEIPIDTQKESAGIVLDHRVESIIKKANDYKAELTKWTKDLAAAPDAFALAEILQRRPAPAF
jgi:hypothetical protein